MASRGTNSRLCLSLRKLTVKYINRIHLEVMLFISVKRIKNLLKLLADLIPFGFRKTDSFPELTESFCGKGKRSVWAP